MLMRSLYCAILSVVVILPFDVSAAETSAMQSEQPKTMPYGDNPNIFRVLIYKTGQSLNRLGNSIQRGADKSSAKISEKWQETKAYSSEQSQLAQQKASNAKTYTEQKWQQTKDAVVGTNGASIPIERGNLSQSAEQVIAPNNTAPAPSSSATVTTTPLPESANP